MMNERDFKDWCEQGDIPKLFLIVDGMTDPRNLGACLRSANAAGVDAVLLPKRRIAPLSSTVMRVAQGGCEELSLVETRKYCENSKMASRKRGMDNRSRRNGRIYLGIQFR